jgi:hypothetical protein
MTVTKRIIKQFARLGNFNAMQDAEAWCEQNGISVGTMQGSSPRGLLYGDFAISKWRNLDERNKFDLDGTMTGDMRNGPVVVSIREPE